MNAGKHTPRDVGRLDRRWRVAATLACLAGAAHGCRSKSVPIGPGDGGSSTGEAGSMVAGGATPDAGETDPRTTVVLFLIDGLMADTARTAANNGAGNIRFVLDHGVTVERVHSTSPATRLILPDGSLPWGNATSGNVAVHTGTHVFEAGSDGMDDIFTAARAGGIKSVFAGGDPNYSAFTTADFHQAGAFADDAVVQQAIDRVRNDGVRLIRVHLQRVRDDWSGPADKTDPASAYLRHVVADDVLLGRLIQTLKDVGVWEQTFLVIASDHGMGQTAASAHPPSTGSSWDPFLAFLGPGLKAGVTIPYAELPDVAVTVVRFLGLPPLRGHTDPAIDPFLPFLRRKGPTGTVLANLYVGTPDDLPHPRPIEAYLNLATFPSTGDSYEAYRNAIMNLVP